MNAHHLPPTFTWKEYLQWVERTNPELPLDEARRVFEMGCERGWVRPWRLNEHDEFVYELVPDPNHERPVRIVVIKKGLN